MAEKTKTDALPGAKPYGEYTPGVMFHPAYATCSLCDEVIPGLKPVPDEYPTCLKCLGEDDPPAPPTFASIAADVAALVEEKSKAYGNAVEWTEKALVDLYPDGVPVAAYKDALLIVRVLDKLKRIATNKDAFGESPWRDLIGYGLLGVSRSQR